MGTPQDTTGGVKLQREPLNKTANKDNPVILNFSTILKKSNISKSCLSKRARPKTSPRLHRQCDVHSLMSAVTMSCMLSRKLARCCVDVWWGEVIWATTAAASALAASTLLSSVKMSARHRIPSTYTDNTVSLQSGFAHVSFSIISYYNTNTTPYFFGVLFFTLNVFSTLFIFLFNSGWI